MTTQIKEVYKIEKRNYFWENLDFGLIHISIDFLKSLYKLVL